MVDLYSSTIPLRISAIPDIVQVEPYPNEWVKTFGVQCLTQMIKSGQSTTQYSGIIGSVAGKWPAISYIILEVIIYKGIIAEHYAQANVLGQPIFYLGKKRYKAGYSSLRESRRQCVLLPVGISKTKRGACSNCIFLATFAAVSCCANKVAESNENKIVKYNFIIKGKLIIKTLKPAKYFLPTCQIKMGHCL